MSDIPKMASEPSPFQCLSLDPSPYQSLDPEPTHQLVSAMNLGKVAATRIAHPKIGSPLAKKDATLHACRAAGHARGGLWVPPTTLRRCKALLLGR